MGKRPFTNEAIAKIHDDYYTSGPPPFVNTGRIEQLTGDGTCLFPNGEAAEAIMREKRILDLERENAEMREFIEDARPILWYLSLAEYPRQENLGLARGAYLCLLHKHPWLEAYLDR